MEVAYQLLPSRAPVQDEMDDIRADLQDDDARSSKSTPHHSHGSEAANDSAYEDLSVPAIYSKRKWWSRDQ